MSRGGATYLALVHHPVQNRAGEVVTTAVTNIDVHDISRSARTYDLAATFIVTPIAVQRELVGGILGHWKDGAGKKRIPERSEALSRTRVVESVEAAEAEIASREGRAPILVGTAARDHGAGVPALEFGAFAAREEPKLLLFGTGHGLHPALLSRCVGLLPPIRADRYNHLSVRAATAIILDRIFGED